MNDLLRNFTMNQKTTKMKHSNFILFIATVITFVFIVISILLFFLTYSILEDVWISMLIVIPIMILIVMAIFKFTDNTKLR